MITTFLVGQFPTESWQASLPIKAAMPSLNERPTRAISWVPVVWGLLPPAPTTMAATIVQKSLAMGGHEAYGHGLLQLR